MAADSRLRLLIFFLSLLSVASAFYIPGWSIKSFSDGEIIPLFYNKIISDKSELQFAFSDLPFVCKPSGRRHGGYLTSGTSMALNLGEVLRGDRIVVSDYELVMGEDQDIRYLCSMQVDAKGLARARQLIRDRYVAEWIVDNLPGATSFVTTDGSRKYYAAGFKLGFEDLDRETGQTHFYINNHVTLVIRYRRAPGRAGDKGKKVIVGFEVYPRSIEAENRNKTTGLPEDLYNVENGMLLDLSANSTYTGEGEAELLTIPYTYSVYFREDDKVDWQNRWDMYFVTQEGSKKIHWFAVVNAIIIAGLLTAVVAVVLARTIRGEMKAGSFKDVEDGKLKIKNIIKGTRSPRKSTDKPSSGLLDQIDVDMDADMSSDDEVEDLTGWKLLHADVFRSPGFGVWLAPLVGSGTQLAFMATGLLLLSCFGILNPSFRGGYISIGVALFVFAGLFSGYFSGRIYRTFGGQLWQKNVVITGCLIPGLLFATVFVLNLFVWAQASSTAIPFGTLVALLALWLLIQLPLVYVGSWVGFVRAGEYSHPVRPNAIPRQIPPQSWYMRSLHSALLTGLVPFAVIFIELMFLFQSIWQDKSGFYYVFGFLTIISLLLLVTVIETSVIATYLLLCAENYHWWWHSFLVGGSSSVWIFGYAIWYYWFKLHITGMVSSMLFFAYAGMACAVYGLLTGTVGFLASYAFVRRIYGAIKVD